MQKIDKIGWKEFEIRQLFTAKNTGNILAHDIIDGTGSTPYVTASGINNGVSAYIDAKNYEKIKGNCILVGGKTFSLSYQEKDFVSNDSHNFFLRLKDASCGHEVYLFLITAINVSLKYKYSWGDAVTKEKILKEKIFLPADTAGAPDFAYMASFMRTRKMIAAQQIDILQKRIYVERRNIDLSHWKPYSLYDKNLFVIDSGTKLDKVKMSTNNPSVNFVGRANANNGVTDFIDQIDGLEPYKAGLLTVSLGGEYLGSCFVQDKPFYTSQNVNVLIPRKEMSYYAKMFIATVIFKEGRLHYKAFVDELNRHMKRDFIIYLPAREDGSPDFDYMDSIMRFHKETIDAFLATFDVKKM